MSNDILISYLLVEFIFGLWYTLLRASELSHERGLYDQHINLCRGPENAWSQREELLAVSSVDLLVAKYRFILNKLGHLNGSKTV
jgi:hypothetical protein